jgi:hypothetical protein
MVVCCLLAVFLSGAVVAAYVWWRRAVPDVPGVSSEGLEPAVGAAIERHARP